MIKIPLLLLSIFMTMVSIAQDTSPNTALLIIDIQEFYFPGGKLELTEPEKASDNAASLLHHFREKDMMVVHVKHDVETGGKIHQSVAPLPGELVITKQDVNCFKEGDLQEILVNNKIENLIICGMQTHMCMEAATRAAADFNFKCTVIADACATRNLEFEGIVVKAEDVHASTLSSLQSYATVMDTQTFLADQK